MFEAIREIMEGNWGLLIASLAIFVSLIVIVPASALMAGTGWAAEYLSMYLDTFCVSLVGLLTAMTYLCAKEAEG